MKNGDKETFEAPYSHLEQALASNPEAVDFLNSSSLIDMNEEIFWEFVSKLFSSALLGIGVDSSLIRLEKHLENQTILSYIEHVMRCVEI